MMMLELFAVTKTVAHTVGQYVFGILMAGTAVFLMLLVLVQRGRGGGLAGALGGPGGQSAFGTKAGDLFTRITMFTATFWILLCMAALLVLNPVPRESDEGGDASPSVNAPTTPGAEKSDTDADEATSDEATSGEATTDDQPETTEGEASKATGEEETPPASDPEKDPAEE